MSLETSAVLMGDTLTQMVAFSIVMLVLGGVVSQSKQKKHRCEKNQTSKKRFDPVKSSREIEKFNCI